MATLYVMCGIPGCGKTTWALNFINNKNINYVSRDKIRMELLKDGEDYFSHEKEVFCKFVNIIRNSLKENKDIIADATHINKFSRKKLFAAIGDIDYSIIFVYFNTPLEVCLGRNGLRSGRARVPDETIKTMWNNFQKPSIIENNKCKGLLLMKGD